MKTELEEIKKQLEGTLDGFKDASENYGYDLANERYYVETALNKVNLLLLHIMSNDYKHIQTKEDYTKLLNSGMFWEFHPELSGNWNDDEKVIKKY